MIKRNYFIKATRYDDRGDIIGYNAIVIAHYSFFAEPVEVMQKYVDKLVARYPDETVMITEFRPV